jgi:IS605 OrfB family transposase
MRRACKITLQYNTQRKHRAIQALLEAYRGAVNFFIRSLWQTPGALDKTTLARLSDANTRLSNRYKAQALRQALAIIIATKKSAKELGRLAGCPVFRGSAILDAKFIDIEVGKKKSFDLVIRLSTLVRGKRITLPTRRTAMLNKWLSKPGSKLIQGGALSNNQIVLWVELPDEAPKIEGMTLGVDVGMCKLLATSDGEFYGTDFRTIRDKVKRCRPGSDGKKRARIERDQYINRVVKQLPWSQINIIAYEDLTDMKRGKGTRSKNFRKAAAPWSYRQVRQRIESLAQENRVRPVAVDPRGTSRTCPMCNTADRRNRKGENFRCIGCDYSADADYVGSLNIRTAALGCVESPRHQCH